MSFKHLVMVGLAFWEPDIKRLLKDDQKVKVLDIWDSKDRDSDIQFFNCDIRNRVKLNKILKDVDIVHHNVALVPLTKSGKEFHSVNVLELKS